MSDRLRGDLIAGLTVWAVLVPEALAYAAIAGVSPVVGLYAAPGALILYAALGSSRHLVTGPMAATAALSAATVGEMAKANTDAFTQLTIALALCVGAAAVLAGLLRLGFLAAFISEPVLKGFVVGLALTIIVGQVPKLLGVDSGDGDFFEKLFDVIGDLGETDALTLAVGAGTLVLVLGLRRVAPAVPGSLVAVGLGIALVELFSLDDHGLDIVGEIDSGLPSFGLPDVSGSDYGSLAAAAIGLMLVGFAEGLGAAKTYAARNHYEIDPGRELIGLGAANLAAGLSSGMGRCPAARQYADVARHPENAEPDGVRVLRIEGGLFFANADSVRAQVRKHAAESGVHAVVLDAEAMPFIDVTAAAMLEQLDDDLARRHVRLLIARDVGLVRDVLRTADDDPSLRHVYPTVQAAVDAASGRS